MMTGTCGVGAPDAPQDLDAVEPGHPDVEQHEIGTQTAQRGERRLAIGRALDAEALALEVLAEHVTHRLLVVDDQNAPQVVGVAAHGTNYLSRGEPGNPHCAGVRPPAEGVGENPAGCRTVGSRRRGGRRRRRRLERGVELGGVLAAGLGHVRPAAAAAADGPGHLLDELAGLESLGQVLGDRRHQVDLALQRRCPRPRCPSRSRSRSRSATARRPSASSPSMRAGQHRHAVHLPRAGRQVVGLRACEPCPPARPAASRARAARPAACAGAAAPRAARS